MSIFRVILSAKYNSDGDATYNLTAVGLAVYVPPSSSLAHCAPCPQSPHLPQQPELILFLATVKLPPASSAPTYPSFHASSPTSAPRSSACSPATAASATASPPSRRSPRTVLPAEVLGFRPSRIRKLQWSHIFWRRRAAILSSTRGIIRVRRVSGVGRCCK